MIAVDNVQGPCILIILAKGALECFLVYCCGLFPSLHVSETNIISLKFV